MSSQPKQFKFANCNKQSKLAVEDETEFIDKTFHKTPRNVDPLIPDSIEQSETFEENDKEADLAANNTELLDTQSFLMNASQISGNTSDTFEHIDVLQLRKYQLELAEKAALKGLNTIICAPTGSGKTLVAAYIIFHHLTNHEATGIKENKVAFLANTIPLATQQHKCLSDYLPNCFKTAILTGESKDNLNLISVLNSNDVVVMTPMILQNNIQFKDFQLNEFSLLIFDECHHTRKGETYNTLMNCYINLKHKEDTHTHMESLPQVVGLTASVGVEKANNLEQAVNSIISLMGNLDVYKLSIVEDNIDDLENFVPKPDDC